MDYDSKHIARLSKRLKDKISASLEFVVVNGDTDQSYPGILFHIFSFQIGHFIIYD